ncbi:MAG: hypothetical protein IKV28_02865 [Bacteroidales bacterium]|nr:hypothetical protein [Bacteroidales bacterium]
MSKIKFLFACLLISLSTLSIAQPMTDSDKLEIGALYPQSEQLSEQAATLLQNNLLQALTLNGISAVDGRYMVLPRFNIVSETVTETAPAKFVVNIEVSLFLVDLHSQIIYSQTMIATKGIGNSADQAILAAIRNISSRNSRLKTFIVKGKEKILEYYNSNAEQLVLRTQAHITRGDYAAALAEINFVPRACADLYNKMSELLTQIPADQRNCCPNFKSDNTQCWLNQIK